MDTTALLIAGMGALATVIGVLFKWGRDSSMGRVKDCRDSCTRRIEELHAAHVLELTRRDEQQAKEAEMVRRLLKAIGATREAAALRPKEDPA